LNTAILTRRLIRFYQDISQGRLRQDETVIPQDSIDEEAFYERHQKGLKLALSYCGTELFFHETPLHHDEEKAFTFENAMASIAYCSLHPSKKEPGKKESCFIEWITLCPALNFNIALITPLSYFQTRHAKPVCYNTFKRLIKPKP